MIGIIFSLPRSYNEHNVQNQPSEDTRYSNPDDVTIFHSSGANENSRGFE
jgi:hypothetical protein